MKREGDTTMKCHPVNTIPSQHNLMSQQSQSSSTIMDFDKQQRAIVIKIDIMARQIFESLRELRDLLSRPPTTSEQIMQADVILEQVKKNQVQLNLFIVNMKKSKSSFITAGGERLKQQSGDMLLKPTTTLFPPRVTLNPILEEHNLKQQQQRLQNYLYRDQKTGLLNVPTLGSRNDQTVPRSGNELRPSNLGMVPSDLNDGVILPVNSLQPQPTPPSRRIVNNFPMTTPSLQTQNEKDAYDILQRIGKCNVFFLYFELILKIYKL